MKLLRWIITTTGVRPVKAVPTYVAWAIRLGVVGSNPEMMMTTATVSALAERFGLRGEPFEAFRKAGVMIPDDPNQAVATIFKAANGRGPDTIRFVHDDAFEAEMLRIESIVLNLQGRQPEELSSQISEIKDTIGALEKLKIKMLQIPASESLKTRTDHKLSEARKNLEDIKRMFDLYEKHERQRRETEEKKANDEFERKASIAEEIITKTRALVERRTPDTIAGIQARIQSLTLEVAESNLRNVESDPHCITERLTFLRNKFAELSDILRRKRQELENFVCVTQATKRSNYRALYTILQTGLNEVEVRIDERYGCYSERFELIQSQKVILGRHEFRIKQEGLPLDQDLRDHCIQDFEPIGDLKQEITRLRMKCESVLQEEQEIEKRRLRFVSAIKKGNIDCRMIEDRIDRFTFCTLRVVIDQKIRLGEWHTFLECHCIELDDSWTKLCELRLMEGQESVDAIHEWTTRLINLCNKTLLLVDAAILRLEEAKISSFLSALTNCRSAQCDAKTRYQTFSHDPFKRIEPLRQLTNELRHHDIHLRDCYNDLHLHELHGRIRDEDCESMNQFGKYREPYDLEESKLSSYLSSVNLFQTLTRFLRNAIPDMAVQYDHHCNPSSPHSNIYISDEICDSVSADLNRLDRTLQSMQNFGSQFGIPSPSIFEQTRDELRREYIRISTSIRELAMQSNQRNSKSLIFNLHRENILADFVAFANEYYSSYIGQRFSVNYVDEIGIDCGGLTRELFTLVGQPLFNRAFIISGKGDFLWLPSNSECSDNHLKDLLAAGLLIRFAFEIGEPIVAPLPISLFRIMKGQQPILEDIHIIHPEIAASLASIEQSFLQGESSGVYLEDGREVTEQLFTQFKDEQLHSLMVRSIAKATVAFRKGFEAGGGKIYQDIPTNTLHARIIRDPIIDWNAMKAGCRLRGYSANDVPVVLFWKVFEELPEQQKLDMLVFMTGSDRPPGKGFQEMPITIHNIEWLGVGKGPIPTASTCFRQLHLPEITDYIEMQHMIQICVEWHHAFHRR
jgi:hypothetical protein